MYEGPDSEHLYASLVHLEYARGLLLRTGLIKRFEDSGWAYGGEEYTGVSDHQVLGCQLESLLYMIEPALWGGLEHIYSLNEGREEWWRGLLHEDGRRIEDPAEIFGEHEDEWAYVVTIGSRNAALVKAYREGLKRLKPNLRFYLESPEPPEPDKEKPVHPAGRKNRRKPVQPAEPAPSPPHFVVVMDIATGATEVDDPYALFDLLVSVWLGLREVRRRVSKRRRSSARARRSSRRRARGTARPKERPTARLTVPDTRKARR